MANKKNPIISEIEDASANYINGVGELNVQDGTTVAILESGAVKHDRKIDEGRYGFDNLILAPLYRGLARASSDPVDARAQIVDALGVGLAIIEHLDQVADVEPEVPAEPAKVEAKVEPELNSDVELSDLDLDLDEEAKAEADAAFADLAE